VEQIKVLYTAEATVTGGRDGHVRSSDGQLELDLVDGVPIRGALHDLISGHEHACKLSTMTNNDSLTESGDAGGLRDTYRQVCAGIGPRRP
jgi:hypothetical protein